MSERGLNHGDRRAAIKRVGSVRMPEPVRRDVAGKPGTAGGVAHNSPDLGARKGAARFARREHRAVIARGTS